MILVTHCSIDAPDGHQWIAAFYTDLDGRPGKRLPVYFTARTQAEVIGKAETWRDEEQAKVADKIAAREQRKREATGRKAGKTRAGKGGAE